MTPEEIKRIEANCVIKTKEDFINECKQAGIPEDWYSFTYDKTKPVCFDGNSVYYGKMGVTNHAVLMTMWDTAFKKLQDYKKQYEWEQSGNIFRIDDINIHSKERISDKRNMEFPYVTIYTCTFTEKPVQSLIDEGWEPGSYSYYMGEFSYTKTADIRTLFDKVEFSFTKKTDDRDKMEFGFTDEFTEGSYHYPLPLEFLEEIAVAKFNKQPLSDELKERLITALASNIVEDEFNALLELRDGHRKALFDAIDSTLSEKEQKDKFAKVSRMVEYSNPAFMNVFGSRSRVITKHNFDLAYQKAGLTRKDVSVKEVNDKFGNKKGF